MQKVSYRKGCEMQKLENNITGNKDWYQLISAPAREFELQNLELLEGKIPKDISGSLYRNGPARLERGGIKAAHLFDGDGAILGLHFNKGNVQAAYQYVKTKWFLKEENENRLIFGGYGSWGPKSKWLSRWKNEIKNAANTSVISVEDKVLALWEGGAPHALKKMSLETIGIDTLGSLAEDTPYSAHPKIDSANQDIYNFGVVYGKDTFINLYRSDKSGRVIQRNQININHLGRPMIHDMALAGNYLVFIVGPVRLELIPFLMRIKGIGESFNWKPEHGTQILIIDKNSLEIVSQNNIESFYLWHFGNGCVNKNGNIILDYVRYENFETNQYLKELMQGKTEIQSEGKLWKIEINPATSSIISHYQVLSRACEFPTPDPTLVGKAWTNTYLALFRKDEKMNKNLFGAVGYYSYEKQELIEFELQSHYSVVEPLYLPSDFNKNGYVVTVVLNSKHKRSEVWIFDGLEIQEGPLSKLLLPSIVPMGFHGTWKSS